MLLLQGCVTPIGFDEPSEVKRQDAIVRAAAREDRSAETMRGLIRQLDSPDSATRFLAIKTLERLTGRNFGYDYAEPAWKREPAVRAWVDWYEQEYGSDTDTEADHG
ncbi:MAG: hypothetical protein Kow0022_10620 [Phycisphaerales bacterium]